jgi:hypothetical protein
VRILSRLVRFLPVFLLQGMLLGYFTLGSAAPPPSAEFDVPYQLRMSDDGTVLEVSGSYSWALPQSLQAVLASAPKVRLIRLESPGGHIQPAIQVATIIHERGLDTYVGRFCASACTIAFLGGRQRWLGPNARLGFHEASAPGFPAELVNGYLRAAYESFHTPSAFIARVLSTPPSGLWFPTRSELQAARYTTGEPPDSVVTQDSGWPPRLRDFGRLVIQAPDAAVIQYAKELSELLKGLQDANPEACWAFGNEGPDATAATLPKAVHERIVDVGNELANAVKTSRQTSWNPELGKDAVKELVASIREKELGPAMQGLRRGAEHATFCPSFNRLLEATQALPASHRVNALRAILSGGERGT